VSIYVSWATAVSVCESEAAHKSKNSREGCTPGAGCVDACTAVECTRQCLADLESSDGVPHVLARQQHNNGKKYVVVEAMLLECNAWLGIGAAR
jgi:hypothetical protein